MPAWLQLAGTLGAAIVGGVITPYVTKSRERRAARADVFGALLDVEQKRWRDFKCEDFQRAAFALPICCRHSQSSSLGGRCLHGSRR